MWIGYPTTQDCHRRQKTWSLNTLTAIVQFIPPRQTRHRQDCFVVSGAEVWTESAQQPDRCILCACDCQMHSDAECTCLAVSSHRHTRHDKTVAPACRPPPRHRPASQLRLATRPPTRSDVVHHTKCKHAVDCCIWLNLNFFTKHHTTRMIHRLTVQTLPDGLETVFTLPHMTQTGPSCLVWWVLWNGHYTVNPHSDILTTIWLYNKQADMSRRQKSLIIKQATNRLVAAVLGSLLPSLSSVVGSYLSSTVFL